jgi:hypothetical protein
MKKLSILALNFFAFLSFSQNVSFEINDAASGFSYKAYYPAENRLTVIVENISCDSLFLSTDNGKITKDINSKCSYVFIPDSLKFTTIFIKKINRNDTIIIGKREVFLKPFPFTVLFGKYYDGWKIQSFGITKEEVKSQVLTIEALNTGLDAKSIISELKIDIIRNNKSIYEKEYKNLKALYWKFSDEELSMIQLGDRIIIYDILYKLGNADIKGDALVISIRE